MSMSSIVPYSSRQRTSLMARLFIAILIVVVFEGALRKWVSEGLTYPLVGLRDALAALGIAYALLHGRASHSRLLFQSLWLWSAVVVIWGLFQTLVNQSSPLVLVLGLRFWLLYLWFAVLAGARMNAYDFRRISQVVVALLIGMVPLAVIQHFLPVTSFWNKQVDEGEVFKVTADIVRTTGTFSFTAGYTTFLALAAPFVFMALERRYHLWSSRWMRYLGLMALLVGTVVSGSRGAIIFTGFIFFVYAGASILSFNLRHIARRIGLFILLAFMLSTFMAIFSRAVDATRERFETAAESETFSGRLAYTFLPQGELSVIGAGIGMGSNFASVLEAGERTFLLAESENARVILEGGVVGWLFIFTKAMVCLLGLFRALNIARRTGSVFCVMLWATTTLAMFTWSMTGQLTINALICLLIGLAVAALRVERHSSAMSATRWR